MKRSYTSLHWVPFWVKKLTAAMLIRMLKANHIKDDIILYNELDRWIRSNGKPTTPYL